MFLSNSRSTLIWDESLKRLGCFQLGSSAVSNLIKGNIFLIYRNTRNPIPRTKILSLAEEKHFEHFEIFRHTSTHYHMS